MNTLLDLIVKSPNVRISFGSGRRKPQEGDTKVVRGETLYRQQVLTRDGYHVRNGRPVFEWVPIRRARVNQKWTKPLREIFEQATSVTLDGAPAVLKQAQRVVSNGRICFQLHMLESSGFRPSDTEVEIDGHVIVFTL